MRQDTVRIRGCLRRSAQAEEVLRQFYAGLGVERGLTPPLLGGGCVNASAGVRMRQDEAKRVEKDRRNRRVHLNERESDLNSSCRDSGTKYGRGGTSPPDSRS